MELTNIAVEGSKELNYVWTVGCIQGDSQLTKQFTSLFVIRRERYRLPQHSAVNHHTNRINHTNSITLMNAQHNSSICQLYKLMNRPAYFTNPKHTSPKIKLIFPAKSLLIPQISQKFTHKFWCNFCGDKGSENRMINSHQQMDYIHPQRCTGAHALKHARTHKRTHKNTARQQRLKVSS